VFDRLKQASHMAGMLKDIPKLKSKLDEVRQKLSTLRVEGSAGGGAVRAVAFCDIRIESVTLDPAVFRGIASGSETDQAYANRMIAEAVNDALNRARARVAEELGNAAKESGVEVPQHLLEKFL
jgi:nucleoid-associated protein EbfC